MREKDATPTSWLPSPKRSDLHDRLCRTLKIEGLPSWYDDSKLRDALARWQKKKQLEHWQDQRKSEKSSER